MRIRQPLGWVTGLFLSLALAGAPALAKEAAKDAPPKDAAAKQAPDASASEAPSTQKPASCKKNSDCPAGSTCKKSGSSSHCTPGPRPIPHVVT